MLIIGSHFLFHTAIRYLNDMHFACGSPVTAREPYILFTFFWIRLSNFTRICHIMLQGSRKSAISWHMKHAPWASDDLRD